MNQIPEPHPFRWYVPENAGTLIIGTFPPTKNRWGYPFFYPNPRNLFWRMMAAIAGKELNHEAEDPVNERRAILDSLRTGVTDMGGIISRLSGNSLDENLQLIEYMPIFEILSESPGISRIILTSSSGKVSALAWFKLYLLEKGVNHIVPKGPKPLQFEINYNERPIRVFVLFSPSPRAANRISQEKLTEMYRKVILMEE